MESVIENPPQSQTAVEEPTKGNADSRPMMTEAPQKDICPHGKTYPRKAVAMVRSRMVTPIIQGCGFKNDLKYSPRPTWK